MFITDRGEEYRVCDECGERFYHGTGDSTIPDSDAMILTGHYHYDPTQTGDVCTRCCKQWGIDVCHGSCLKWFYVSALNSDGECCYCEGDRIARGYDSIYIDGPSVGLILVKTNRDYVRMRYLISEAIMLGSTLKYLCEMEGWK